MTNIAILTGRIARDPETRETKGGTNVTGITVVTDRPARDKDGKTYKDENGYTAKESEFHRVTCFNGLAKTVGQYCTKGQLVSASRAASTTPSGTIRTGLRATAPRSSPTRWTFSRVAMARVTRTTTRMLPRSTELSRRSLLGRGPVPAGQGPFFVPISQASLEREKKKRKRLAALGPLPPPALRAQRRLSPDLSLRTFQRLSRGLRCPVQEQPAFRVLSGARRVSIGRLRACGVRLLRFVSMALGILPLSPPMILSSADMH